MDGKPAPSHNTSTLSFSADAAVALVLFFYVNCCPKRSRVFTLWKMALRHLPHHHHTCMPSGVLFPVTFLLTVKIYYMAISNTNGIRGSSGSGLMNGCFHDVVRSDVVVAGDRQSGRFHGNSKRIGKFTVKRRRTD